MMDQLAPQAYNPHLKKVLKSFQTAAERSLNGPSNYVETWGDAAKMTARELEEYRKTLLNGTLKTNTAEADINDVGAYLTQSPFPIKQMPIIIPMDTSKGEISDTELDGKSIACFIVGGEKRLCLPQILNTVLGDFSLQDIHNVCDELHIFCSRCNPEQLKFFKMTGILPVNAPSCGLITKTDAERLCNALLHRSPEKSFEAPSPNSFKVYHECFGKCKGVLSPELYRDPEAKCIQCVDCRGVFAPQHFVCHSHKAQENRTCHWGFDSANWRSYLLLANDQDSKRTLQKFLDDIKSRFDFVGRYKRRETSGKDESGIKKARYDDGGAYETGAWIDASAYRQGISAFRPWSPTVLSMLKEGKVIPVPGPRDGLTTVIPSYLQTGPPVLLNPERVVRLTDSHRYDRHFAPNVSLAPQALQKFPGEEEEEEEEDVKPPKNLNFSPVTSPVKSSPHLDVELSSDTEDSSFHSDSMPSTPRDCLLSPIAEVAADREKEVEMLWQVLDGKIGDSRQSKEKFIQEFLHLRFRQDDRLRRTLRANKQLEQNLEAIRKQQALQEASTEAEQLRREIDKLHYQTELQNKENQQLRQELELLRDVTHSEVVSVKAKYRGKIEDLRQTVRTYEHTTAQLQSEVNELRGKMDGHFTSGETENHTPSPNSSNGTATTLSPARDSGVEEDAASASQKSHTATDTATAVGSVKAETVNVETS